MNIGRLIGLLIATLLTFAEPIRAAQWSPSLSTVIQGANKEGKLKLMWGEGTLGGTKGAAQVRVDDQQDVWHEYQNRLHSRTSDAADGQPNRG